MARLTLKLLKIVPPFTLALDRTEWQLGKSWVNVLMLSVSYRQMAIPLFWTVIETKGCCDDAEKQAIIEQFLEEFRRRASGSSGLTGSLRAKSGCNIWLNKRSVFDLRIKANVRITDKHGKLIRASKMCRTLKTDQRMEFRRQRRLWNQVGICGGVPQSRWR